MKYMVIDWETSNYNYGSAFDPRNYPVALVVLHVNGKERKVYKYYFLNQKFSNCTLDEIDSLLKENKDVQIIGHNLRFDLHWNNRLSLEHGSNLYDTMFLPYLELLGRMGRGKLTLETLSGTKDKLGNLLVHKHKVNPANISPKILLHYCLKDVLATEKLYLEQRRKLCSVEKPEAFNNPHKLMCRLLPILIECEQNGFKLDLDTLNSIYNEQKEVQEALIKEVLDILESKHGLLGFNVNSHDQIAAFLYSKKLKKEKRIVWSFFFENFNQFSRGAEKEYWSMLNECFEDTGYGLGIEPPMQAMGKASLSTDMDTLKELIRNNQDHQGIDLLDKFYKISRQKTLISTFIEGVLGGGPKNKEPKFFMGEDGAYLHTSYNQTVTATGRLSSSNPNLQNWPREGTFPIRCCIISRFKGGSIASADASQIELRYAGWYYDDKVMRDDFERGVDIHGTCASMAYGKDFSDENRTASKSVVFRTIYRGGARGILVDPKIPVYDLEEIQTIIDSIYGRYTKLQAGQEEDFLEVSEGGPSSGYLTTPTGRRYKFDVKHYSLKNKVANYPIQGGATGDFIPCAMIACDIRMKEEGVQSLMIGQIHDDIIFDVFPGEEDQMKEISKWALTEGGREVFNELFGLNFDFPLDSDWKIKEHW